MITIKEYDRRESKSNGDTFAGLEYDSEIGNEDGAIITLFVPKGTPGETIDAAKDAARAARDVVQFKLEEPPTCEHDSHEDCMNCTECGQCREDLDSNDLCKNCGGVDENETVQCEGKNCEMDMILHPEAEYMDGCNVVTTASGDDIRYCGSCYDAYIVGLNRGMGMIIELPESIKRSRLADCLREHRNTVDYDLAMIGKSMALGLAIGLCHALNVNPETYAQIKRILLSRVKENDE